MLRLICGGVLCMCSSYIGLCVKRYYHTRYMFFLDLIRFIELLHEEISFMKTPLKKIISTFSDGKKGEFVKVLAVYEKMLCVENTSSEKVSTKINSLYINKSEKELLSYMLGQLGKLDVSTQLTNLANFKSRINTICEDCKKKSNTIGGLAFKLGVLIGIMVMIIVA